MNASAGSRDVHHLLTGVHSSSLNNPEDSKAVIPLSREKQMVNPGSAKFDEMLRRWNGGIFRGAAARLARKLNVGRSAVSGWRTGTIHPSEQMMMRLADTFNVKVDEIAECFPRENTVNVLQLVLNRLDDLEKRVDALLKKPGKRRSS